MQKPYLRFSLRFLLIAITVGSVLSFGGYRTIYGSAADQRAAATVAKEIVLAEPAFNVFEVKRVRPAGVSPRAYRVYGIADDNRHIALRVFKQGDSFVWDIDRGFDAQW